mmetsp:Transcript_50037/g.106941  ORF Transcript_50037/g.106941 Transcript_50037/m.106941 type:complete len:235 (-) Transcript_50037:192-896(-)
MLHVCSARLLHACVCANLCMQMRAHARARTLPCAARVCVCQRVRTERNTPAEVRPMGRPRGRADLMLTWQEAVRRAESRRGWRVELTRADSGTAARVAASGSRGLGRLRGRLRGGAQRWRLRAIEERLAPEREFALLIDSDREHEMACVCRHLRDGQVGHLPSLPRDGAIVGWWRLHFDEDEASGRLASRLQLDGLRPLERQRRSCGRDHVYLSSWTLQCNRAREELPLLAGGA